MSTAPGDRNGRTRGITPLLIQGTYFLTLFAIKGVVWSVNLWMGSIVIAGMIGLLLSYLLRHKSTALKKHYEQKNEAFQTWITIKRGPAVWFPRTLSR